MRIRAAQVAPVLMQLWRGGCRETYAMVSPVAPTTTPTLNGPLWRKPLVASRRSVEVEKGRQEQGRLALLSPLFTCLRQSNHRC